MWMLGGLVLSTCGCSRPSSPHQPTLLGELPSRHPARKRKKAIPSPRWSFDLKDHACWYMLCFLCVLRLFAPWKFKLPGLSGVQLSPASASQRRGINAKKVLLHASKWQQAHGDLHKICPFRLQHRLEVMYLEHIWMFVFGIHGASPIKPPWSSLDSVPFYHLGSWVSQRDTLHLASASRRRRWENERYLVAEMDWTLIETLKIMAFHSFRKSFLGCDCCIYYQNQSWLSYIYVLEYCIVVMLKHIGEIWIMTLERARFFIHLPTNSAGHFGYRSFVTEAFWLHLSRPWIITGCCGHVA